MAKLGGKTTGSHPVSQGKKRKHEVRDDHHDTEFNSEEQEEISASTPKRGRPNAPELDTSKPSAVFQPKEGRNWTVSIAVPGSFIANTKDINQKNELVARIARAAAVFCVDEIVVFDDAPSTIPPHLLYAGNRNKSKIDVLAEVEVAAEPWDNPDQFLYHVLEFLECPGHLRRHLYEHHPNLKGVGKLPTLDMPHHMREDEWCQYRDGASIGPAGSHGKMSEYTLVDCGLQYPVKVHAVIEPNQRVTLKFANATPPPRWPNLSESAIANLEVDPVPPHMPREEGGYYWGFSVRKANGLSAVMTESPYADDGGYDFSLGTSERGVPLSSIIPNTSSSSKTSKKKNPEYEDNKLPASFNHLLLVFGGVAGLEPAVAGDPELKVRGLTKETAHVLFDAWVDLLPGQGSRTIRTEEAVLMGLMGLSNYIASNQRE